MLPQGVEAMVRVIRCPEGQHANNWRAWLIRGGLLLALLIFLCSCSSEADKHKRIFMGQCVQVPAMEAVCSCTFGKIRKEMSDEDMRKFMTEPNSRPEFVRIMSNSMVQCVKENR
jgi:hypothetical protein